MNIYSNKYHGGRKKKDVVTGSVASYKIFKKEHPTINISSTEYIKIIRALNTEYSRHIIEESEVLNLPHGLGTFFIHKKQCRKFRIDENGEKHVNLAINWAATDKANANLKEGEKKVRIYHMNDHSNGMICKWFFYKNPKTCRIPSANIWKFHTCKKNETNLGKFIIEHPERSQFYISIKG